MPASDSELLKRFVTERSEEAFAEIVRRHAGMVRDVATRMLGDAAAAEDATQASFLALARKARSLDGRGTLAGWLFRTVELACRNALRERRRRARREREVAMVRKDRTPSTSPTGATDMGLDTAVAALPMAYREAVALRYYQGLSGLEIAERLGCSESAVKKRLTRALSRLRDRLSRKDVSVAALASLLSARLASPASEALISSIQGACLGGAAPSAGALLMMEGVMRMMLIAKLKLTAAALCAVAGLSLAVPVTVHAVRAGEPAGRPAAAPGPERGEEPAKADQKALIAGLIEQLGDKDFEKREAAYQKLLKIGAPARSQLEAASKDKDPERATRARKLIGLLSTATTGELDYTSIRVIRRLFTGDRTSPKITEEEARAILSKLTPEDLAIYRQCLTARKAYDAAMRTAATREERGTAGQMYLGEVARLQALLKANREKK
jgi:RNA polymerase sigma factor (sigma-70 family)